MDRAASLKKSKRLQSELLGISDDGRHLIATGRNEIEWIDLETHEIQRASLNASRQRSGRGLLAKGWIYLPTMGSIIMVKQNAIPKDRTEVTEAAVIGLPAVESKKVFSGNLVVNNSHLIIAAPNGIWSVGKLPDDKPKSDRLKSVE